MHPHTARKLGFSEQALESLGSSLRIGRDYMLRILADLPSTIAKEDLLTERLLLLGEGHCFRDQILEACPAISAQLNNPSNTLIAEGGSLETIRHMVASGLGITVLPHSAIGTGHYESGLLESRPFTPQAPSRAVAIAWRASFPRPKAIDALINAIEQCRQEQSAPLPA